VIVGCSQYVLDVHSSLVDLQHTPQVLNYPGVPLGEPRETASRGPTPTVGFIGTLAPHKGVQVLLEAWRQAPGAWRLLVAGSGVLERDVARAASELRSIEVLGEVTGEAKERFFSRLDALVVPSVWEEPFGQVGIEALVRGVPVVAARRGGLAEIPLARLFEPTRADELIAALGDVLTDDYFERFRERALAERERWSLERNVRAQEDILESVARGDVV
jgi:glycosyltransferase involved in cell wall biosynthesis